MKAREVVLQAIQPVNGKRPQRIPAALLSAGTWTFLQKGLSLKDILDEPERAAEIIRNVNATVHSDIVWPGSGYHNLLPYIFGAEIRFRPMGNIDVVRPAFQSLAELDNIRLEAIDDHPWIIAIRRIIGETHGLVGDETLVGTSSWGPFTLAGQFYGVEKLMSGLYKDKRSVHALLDAMTDICCAYLEPAIERGAKILSIAEPTASGDLISLRHFEEFAAHYLAKAIGRLKQKGALITLHICGNITDRLGLAPDIGVDLLSVDYKVDLKTVARKLNGRAALAGNVNPILLKDGSPQNVVEAARSCIEQVVDYDRFVLMPGCDIPPAVPIGNIEAFIKATK